MKKTVITKHTQLTENWVKIESSGIGMVFVIKLDKIYIYSCRVYSSDFYSLTNEKFDKWRINCNKEW